jgi:hypothetical protein
MQKMLKRNQRPSLAALPTSAPPPHMEQSGHFRHAALPLPGITAWDLLYST